MSLDEWRSVPLIFVDDLGHPRLSADDLHHFGRVRRLADGAPITISDGQGRWCPARFGPTPEATAEVNRQPPPLAPSAVGFAPVKGERPEWVVQKLTELGVDVIVPLRTERSVVRWDESRAAKQVAKWRMIAREAAMQSRRVWIPEIRPVTALAALADDQALSGGVLAEPGAPPLDGRHDRVILIGPEGGWVPAELATRPQRSLPGGILRAETAALAAAVLLADGGRPSAPVDPSSS